MSLWLVGAGGTVGAVARHLVGTAIERDRWDTFAVNVVGSLALGALLASPVGDRATLLAGTGFCGAFTTFSSFAVETVRLAERGEAGRAMAYATGTLAVALTAVALGAALASALV